MVKQSTPDISLESVDALMLAGDIDATLAALDELRQLVGAGAPALAWRTGVVHYLLRGSPREALAGMQRADLGAEQTTDEAILLGWLASAHWALGDMAACADHAVRAGAAAERCDDDRARAAAHVALGLQAMLAGDRIAYAAHHTKALRFASSAGDIIQQIRIRMNQASHHAEEAQFDDALTALGIAVRLAESSGNEVLLAVALSNEGDAMNALGRLAEAEKRFRRSIEICQRMESAKICFGLLGLGDVLRRRGQHALARAAYEEVGPLAEQHGQIQVLVAALAGMSDILADTDSATAVELATRARAEAVGPFMTVATLALARATLAGGDREAAARLADQAQAQARTHRDRVGVARALEMQAQTCDEWERAGRHLAEARAIWTDIGAGIDADRVMLALARLPVVTSETYIDANLAAERLAAAGLPTAALHRAGDPSSRASIRTLGRFEVMVAGKVMPPAAWQSRKARDLLRLLVARRGRPATREELTELLWADEPVSGTDRRGHRLAVALSIIRGVVDSAGSAADSVVLADGGSHAGIRGGA
ncbi:tetratricopeptide repeat protein [Catellatospora vulcania]|uniref:tetratricopeptide repeat protein n=1 Tax=Catellatospora vulcania TaxID=1460450 RepID=UPI0012D461C8|nr:tetratricopeptide repeat protein [Catellatospora vulcania]